MMDRDSVEKALNDRIRPAIRMDGGDIELVDVKENKVYVRLQGACSHCPSATMTLSMGVERLLKETFPELEGVVRV